MRGAIQRMENTIESRTHHDDVLLSCFFLLWSRIGPMAIIRSSVSSRTGVPRGGVVDAHAGFVGHDA
jgi:hypothetical protein